MIAKEGAVECIIAAMKLGSVKSMLQRLGCGTLKNLMTNIPASKDSIAAPDREGVILAAMRHHVGKLILQKNSLDALKQQAIKNAGHQDVITGNGIAHILASMDLYEQWKCLRASSGCHGNTSQGSSFSKDGIYYATHIWIGFCGWWDNCCLCCESNGRVKQKHFHTETWLQYSQECFPQPWTSCVHY